MIYNACLSFSEQPSADINQAQSNTLKAFTLGGGMVYLNVAGVVDSRANGEGAIATLMTVEECLALVKMLLAACDAADQLVHTGLGAQVTGWKS